MLIQPDWVFEDRNLGVLWQRHVGEMAGVIGAKKVGGAPLRIRSAQGYEAEILLPKKDNKRLWMALLLQGPIVLSLVVVHHLKDRAWFEPEVSALIASLRFVDHVESMQSIHEIPLPDGYTPADPANLISGIQDASRWRGFSGPASTGALQAFYLRELGNAGWQLLGYSPYPSQINQAGIALFQIKKGDMACKLGILPAIQPESERESNANIVIQC